MVKNLDKKEKADLICKLSNKLQITDPGNDHENIQGLDSGTTENIKHKQL